MNENPWLAHYDPGVPQNIDYPKVPLSYFLEESARKYPDRACTIFKGAEISFKEMNEISDQIAGALADLGVKKGDRVGIFMPNTPQAAWWSQPIRFTRQMKSSIKSMMPVSRLCS